MNNLLIRLAQCHAGRVELRFESDTFDITGISFALHERPLSIRERVLKKMVRCADSWR